jgi:GNAT superfamily N-acetyltransferase
LDHSIRLAEERDIPALCEIWKVCFCDKEDYVRFFYRETDGFVTTTVYTVDDRPVSVLHWFDVTFVNGKERKEGKYLYAGGSLPEYRKNGYYGSLIRYAEEYADKNSLVLFGKPANEKLIPYYRTFDFIPDASFRLVTLSPGERVPVSFYPVSPEEYNSMRNRAFSSHPYAKWPDRYVRYCVAEYSYFGGKTLAFEYDGEVHFLMGTKKENVLLLTETDLSVSKLKEVSGALCALFEADTLKAYLPDRSCGEGEEIVSSVAYNSPLCNTYVNLLLI